MGARNARSRRRRHPALSPYAEFYDDEDDLDMKHHGGADARTDVDASSLDGASPPRRAFRGGGGVDEDSIFSGLESTPGGGGNNATADGEEPTWVHTRDYGDAGSAAMTAEQGYEFGYGGAMTPGSDAFPHEVFPTGGYEPRVRAEGPPGYVNPAHIGRSTERNNGRGYFVGDTVEF